MLYDGVEEQDLDGPVEVLGIIADQHGVTTFSGVEIRVRSRWSPRSADVIVVPGGGLGEGSAVEEQIGRGVLPRALAAAGITDGRSCTTHHAAKQDLRARGGRVVDGRVVDDGDLVTSGGVTSGLDLALWLVERFYGAETALFAEKVLEHERRGTVWRAGD
ncbi:DJ-1/PfpI family protein [Actinomadura namibiensis]|uniref:DJ-1/PfpI domain-containing protein n=1 Tax=Actinomadura namibiensis TaxID=182080 RepID=A0A7W3QML4_ACTNM|nr:DJ-1/PfpI family protein [Actinomadura namibiensis]MBA8952631.1 hypothetical protein [Actinomadura namibiensis]